MHTPYLRRGCLALPVDEPATILEMSSFVLPSDSKAASSAGCSIFSRLPVESTCLVGNKAERLMPANDVGPLGFLLTFPSSFSSWTTKSQAQISAVVAVTLVMFA